jgi:hypothetical protein
MFFAPHIRAFPVTRQGWKKTGSVPVFFVPLIRSIYLFYRSMNKGFSTVNVHKNGFCWEKPDTDTKEEMADE